MTMFWGRGFTKVFFRVVAHGDIDRGSLHVSLDAMVQKKQVAHYSISLGHNRQKVSWADNFNSYFLSLFCGYLGRENWRIFRCLNLFLLEICVFFLLCCLKCKV